MPTQLVLWKAKPKEPIAKVLEGPPGSETAARHQGRVGNSGDLMTSSAAGVERHNRQTGRTLNGTWEVGCLHSSEDVG